MDVRPGGTWKAHMVAGPAQMDWKGEYVEVDEPERLVFTITDQPDNPARDTITITLAENDGKTDMVYRQSGGNLDAAGYEQAKQGTAGFLDKLEEIVTNSLSEVAHLTDRARSRSRDEGVPLVFDPVRPLRRPVRRRASTMAARTAGSFDSPTTTLIPPAATRPRARSLSSA